METKISSFQVHIKSNIFQRALQETDHDYSLYTMPSPRLMRAAQTLTILLMLARGFLSTSSVIFVVASFEWKWGLEVFCTYS